MRATERHEFQTPDCFKTLSTDVTQILRYLAIRISLLSFEFQS